jgi:hypothetical protein
MRVEELTKNHETQLIELLMSDRDNPQVEYYLERKNGFWKPYDWYSKGNNSGWVVYEGDQLVAISALVKLPFSIESTRMPVFLNTDYFVHFKHRKSLAAYRLLSMLQKNPPLNGDCFEIGVENQPGFLTPLSSMSEKYGHVTGWLRETNLRQFFISYRHKSISKSHQIFTSDSRTIEEYFKNYLIKDQSHAILNFDQSIRITDLPQLRFFEIKNEDQFLRGLLFDKSQMQKVLWNGQPRLYIEKYRRMLSQHYGENLSAGDELRFLHLNCLQHNITSPAFLNECALILNNFCFEHKYFCWTIRDLTTHIESSIFDDIKIDNTQFSCRVPLTTNKKADFEKVKYDLDQKRIVLESMFL